MVDIHIWWNFCIWYLMNWSNHFVWSFIIPRTVMYLDIIIAWSTPSHCPNQWQNIINLNLKNELKRKLQRNSCIFIQENACQNVVCEMVAHFSRPQCVSVYSPGHLWKTGTVWPLAGIFQICLEVEFGSIHTRQEYVSRCAFPTGVGNPATEAWPLIQGQALSTSPVKIPDFVIGKLKKYKMQNKGEKKCFCNALLTESIIFG